MDGRALVLLCFLVAGLRAQSKSTSPVSLLAKVTSLETSSASTSSAVPTMPPTGSTQDTLGLLVTTAATPTPFLKNTSSEPAKEAITSPSPSQEGTSPGPSPTGLTSTAGGIPSTLTPEEHSLGGPEASMPTTGWQSPTPLSPQDVTSSLSSLPSLSTQPPPAPSASIPSNHSAQVPSTQPPVAPTTPASSTERPSSDHTSTPHTTVELEPRENTAQDAQPGKGICASETTTPFLIMQEVGHALSSGSIAAITVTVIAVVVLVFGVAAYLKIRHSSYGRLLDDHDYGSWGNYNNPLYDDS